nr:DUF2125 domain-containing protein [Rhodospirillum rubrum]
MTGLYAGLWVYTARQAGQALDRWIADREAEGFVPRHRGIETGGFPLAVRLTITAPSLTAPEDLGEWSWSAPRLTASLTPFAPRHVTLDAPGPHLIALPGDGEGKKPSLAISGKTMTAALDIGPDGAISESKVALEDLSISGGTGAPTTLDSLSLHTLAGALYPAAGGGAAAQSALLEMRGLRPPPDGRIGLSETLTALSMKARLIGRLPGGPLEPALTRWRDDNGTLRIDDLSVTWPPLSLRASGSLGVDRDLQPSGGLSVQARGLFELIRGFADQGWTRTVDSDMARMVLSGMFRDGQITLPVTIRDRVLYGGPARLLDLPTVTWGPKGPRALNRIAPGFAIDQQGKALRPVDSEALPQRTTPR